MVIQNVNTSEEDKVLKKLPIPYKDSRVVFNLVKVELDYFLEFELISR